MKGCLFVYLEVGGQDFFNKSRKERMMVIGRSGIEARGDAEMAVRLPYREDWVALIRQVDGRSWFPKEREWRLPATEASAQRLVELFGNESVQVEQALLERFLCFAYFQDKTSTFKLVTSVETTLRRISQELRLRGFSFQTQKAYLGHLRRFMNYVDKPAAEARTEDVKRYMLTLLEQGRSHSFVNQASSALRFGLLGVLRLPELPVTK